MRKALPRAMVLLVTVGMVVPAACSREETAPTTTFYERKIGPVLQTSCANSPTTSGCHVSADDRGNALGNLNLTSYDALAKRHDLLVEYGPYGMPNLLLKAVPPFTMRLTTYDNEVLLVDTDIPHAGGSLFDVTSTSFTTLQRWLERGATENNAEPPEPEYDLQPCTDTLGEDSLFDPGVEPSTPDFAQFRDSVAPVLAQSCAAGNCHGNPSNSLYLTCGSSPEQLRWNYFAAGDYVNPDPDASEIVRRGLDPAQGGTFHEGGTIFSNANEPGYRAILDWAAAKGGPTNVPTNEGFEFFAKRVQPMLAKKGCMILGCHSPAMFHDYRLRGGSGGHFGLPATRRNYDLSLEQVALESPNPNASRLIRKNLPPSEGGMLHRGGSLLAAGGDPSACDMDAAENGPLNDQSPYCVMVAWIEKERQARMASAKVLESIVYVRRPPRAGGTRPQDWDNYQPGADLLSAPASLDAQGVLSASGGSSLLGGCGLTAASADIRRPAVSWDGTRIAFAARTSASEGFRVYVMNADGSDCAVEPTIDAAPVDWDGNAVPTNGEIIHNFDPAFAPDGRIVFASTRGNVMNPGVFSYSGPTRTPADPSKLNVNLYVAENGGVRQMTFLLNHEFLPSFMSDGRLIFTTEKRAPGFYQLAGRRENLDGGDYHPLFAQRDTIGFDQFTDVVELADKNLVAVVSQRGAAHSAGALMVVNRSIGVDQLSLDESDYTMDPGAMFWPNPKFYQHAARLVDPAATGRLDGTQGAYRNPSPLPNGTLVVSYAGGVTDLGNFAGNFDLVQIDPVTGQRTDVLADAQDLLWPVAVYARPQREIFESRVDEPNGHTEVYTTPDRREKSDITFIDFPLLATLLFQNTRSSRQLVTGTGELIQVWESLPPEPGVTGFDGSAFVVDDEYGQVYVRRRLIGSASPNSDGSARVRIPGGMPIVLATKVQLAEDAEPVLHHQREEMQFYPGEWAHQSFQRGLFNGLCGGCHGSVSGLEDEIAVNPDILTSASTVAASDAPPIDISSPPSGDPEAPPFP